MRWLGVLRSVEDVAIELGVSKTAIYNKLKLNNFRKRIVKKSARTMIDEELFNLIKDSLKVKSEVESEVYEDDVKQYISIDEDDSLNLNKELIRGLLEQLKNKDKQIDELHKLIENNQILLKQQQDKELKQLQLEEHFQEVDERLNEIRGKMELKKEENKGFLKRIFQK